MLRLHQAWETRVPAEGGGILLSDLRTGRLLRLRGDTARWQSLFRLLGEGADEQDLGDVLWPAARVALDYLRDEGALVSRELGVITDAAFDRQIRFFDLYETGELSGTDLHERLRDSRVVLVGLGGYGVWLATLLSRMGVRDLVGVDDDEVELSNLHRQFLYTRDDVGRHKAAVCAERLESFTPVVERVTDPGRFAELVSGADLVVNAFGYGLPDERHEHPRTFHTVARGCELAGTPSLTFGGSWHGPLRVPGTAGACAGCLTMTEPFRSRLVHHPRPVLRSPAPAMPARLGINASICVWEAARHLSGMGTPLRSAAAVLDTIDYTTMRLVPLERVAGCVVCGE